MNNLDVLHARAKALGLHGLLAHWHDATAAGWLHDLIEWEEQERARRSLERRLKDAHIGRFKPLCDFDWAWPKKCDKPAIEALMSLLNDATNAILVGPNGIGKSTLAQYLGASLDSRYSVSTRGPKIFLISLTHEFLACALYSRWRPSRLHSAMPIASSCKTSESQAFMLFMLLMSIASGSNRIDLPDFVKRISGLFVALY
jgi:IstB-like ATP binding protein